MGENRGERIARNQALWREGQEMAEARVDRVRTDYLCECDDTQCMDTVPLTFSEYQQIRANPDHYVVTPGHEGTGSVVEAHDLYIVLTKGA